MGNRPVRVGLDEPSPQRRWAAALTFGRIRSENCFCHWKVAGVISWIRERLSPPAAELDLNRKVSASTRSVLRTQFIQTLLLFSSSGFHVLFSPFCDFIQFFLSLFPDPSFSFTFCSFYFEKVDWKTSNQFFFLECFPFSQFETRIIPDFHFPAELSKVQIVFWVILSEKPPLVVQRVPWRHRNVSMGHGTCHTAHF